MYKGKHTFCSETDRKQSGNQSFSRNFTTLQLTMDVKKVVAKLLKTLAFAFLRMMIQPIQDTRWMRR